MHSKTLGSKVAFAPLTPAKKESGIALKRKKGEAVSALVDDGSWIIMKESEIAQKRTRKVMPSRLSWMMDRGSS